MKRFRSTSSWHRRAGVRDYFAGTTIDTFGAEITAVAIPLVAISVLSASDTWVVAIESATLWAGVLLALPLGWLADSRPKRAFLVGANTGSALLLLLLVLVLVSDSMTVWLLLAFGLALAVLSMIRDLTAGAVLPLLLPKDELAPANARINGVVTVAEVSGGGVAGAIISALGSVGGLLTNMGTFLLSAFFFARMSSLSVPRTKVEDTGVSAKSAIREILSGAKVVKRDSRLFRIVGFAATSNAFSTMAGSVEIIFLVRNLEVSAFGVGIAFSISALGGVIGGLLLPALTRGLGAIRMMFWGQLVLILPMLLLPLASPGPGVILYLVAWFFYSLSSVIYNTGSDIYRQTVVPEGLLGRVGALGLWVGSAACLIGSGVAVALVAFASVWVTVLVSSLGIVLSSLWLMTPLFFSAPRDLSSELTGS